MPKVYKILALICILLTMCCSCQKSEPEVKEIDYTQLGTPKSQTDTQSISPSSITPTAIPEINNEVEITTAISKEAFETTDSKKDDILKAWPVDFDLKAVFTNITNSSGNFNSHYKSDPIVSFLLCPDKDNNVLYYINYGMDNSIYQLKDGKSTLLVEKEASFLQLWNNELYFLSNNHKSDTVYTGDIYCYNLITKELRLILETDAQSLHIDSQGIFFEKLLDINAREYKGYTMDFNSQEPQEVEYVNPISFNEYQIYATKDGMFLNNMETQKVLKIAPFNYINYRIGIYDDLLIFLEKSCIYTLNLTNGEKKVFNVNDCNTMNMDYNFDYINDYTVVNGIIYTDTFSIDMSNGEITALHQKSFVQGDKFIINYLYTDGNKIYALVTYEQGNIQKMVELSYSDDNLVSAKELGK